MTALSRRALLRELSGSADPDHRFWETPVDRLDEDFIVLLRFAADVTGVDPTALRPLDLMAHLSSLRAARKA